MRKTDSVFEPITFPGEQITLLSCDVFSLQSVLLFILRTEERIKNIPSTLNKQYA